MKDEIITVRITESDKTLDVLVYRKTEHKIEVMVGEGIHSTKCELGPTANKLAYAGNVMGREIVYERSTQQVHEDIEAAKPSTRQR
ncbi:MAG: hypothetical protein OEY11_12845 [Gammaproteobacteria bacterium]|nr:hypothetical protein [Gammaproteobacteria bacterium]